MQGISVFRAKLADFIPRYWLPAGLIGLLSGLFWLPSLGLYNKQYYALFALPSLLALLIAPGHLGRLIREPLIQAFLAFSLWVLLSLLWTQADDSLSGLAKRPLYVLLLLAGCVLLAVHNLRVFAQLLHGCAWLAVLAALMALYYQAGGLTGEVRIIGTGALRNPLLSSQVFGFFCVYWLCQGIHARGRNLCLAGLASAILFATLLATGSRTPLLGIFAAGLWLAAAAGKRGIYISLALIAAGAIAIIAMPGMQERGLSYRPEIWMEALRQAANHPWMGLGYNSSYVFNLTHQWYDPHNVELAVLLELGAIGLALWLLMHAVALWRSWQCRQDSRFVIASALLVHGMACGLTEGSNFLSRPNENWFLIWIPLALVAALSAAKRVDLAGTKVRDRCVKTA